MTDSEGGEEEATATGSQMPFRFVPISPDTGGLFYNLGNGWDVIADAYFDVAISLTYELPENDESGTDMLFPLMFLYRHAIELSLKDLHDAVGRLHGVTHFDNKSGHRLDRLLSRLEERLPSDIAETESGGDGFPLRTTKEAIDEIRNSTDWFSSFDENSERFRYPVDKRGRKHPYPRLIDWGGPYSPEELREQIIATIVGLRQVYTIISVHLDFQEHSRSVD